MRAAFVLRVAGLEMAAVIGCKDHDGVGGQAGLHQRTAQAPHGVVDARHASVVIGQLARPGSRQPPQILGDKRVGIAVRVFLGRNVGIEIVLVVHLQVRYGQQKGRLGRPQEALGTLGHEVRAVLAGKVERLARRVEEVAFIGVRGVLQLVGGLPEIQEATAVGGGDGAMRFGARIVVGRQMPLADIVGGIARLAKRAGKRDGLLVQSQAVPPDAVADGVLPGEDGPARRSAHRLVGAGRAEEHAFRSHGVEVGREVHGVGAHGSDAVRPKLIGDDQQDIRSRTGSAGLRHRGRGGHRSGQAGQQVSAGHMKASYHRDPGRLGTAAAIGLAYQASYIYTFRMIKTRLIAAVLGSMLLIGGIAVAQKPKENVSAARHPNIAAAQDLCRQAYEKIVAAQKANEWDMAGHAQKAKNLLDQVNNQLKMAAEAANANKK